MVPQICELEHLLFCFLTFFVHFGFWRWRESIRLVSVFVFPIFRAERSSVRPISALQTFTVCAPLSIYYLQQEHLLFQEEHLLFRFREPRASVVFGTGASIWRTIYWEAALERIY